MSGLPPICYLDVGGVVYYAPLMMRYKSQPLTELRPHLIAFLKCVHDAGYELRLLSGDPMAAGAFILLLREMFQDNFKYWDFRAVRNAYGSSVDQNDAVAHKGAYLDLSRPFIWIEDGILDLDRQFLASRGWLGRYCQVSPLKPDELLAVKEWVLSHPITKLARSGLPSREQGGRI